MKRGSCILLLILAVIGCTSAAEELWKGCYPLPSPLNELCAKLLYTPPCDLRMIVTAAGMEIVNEPVDLTASTEICRTYFGTLYCVQLQNLTVANDGQVHPCVMFKQVKDGQSTYHNLGCITGANTLAQCLVQGCPNGCSGRGICGNDGKCICNFAWYGDDCSAAAPLYVQCQDFPNYGSFCMKITIEDCGIKVQVYPQLLPSVVLYDTTISAGNFNSYFRQSVCFEYTPAKLCLGWNNLVLNETYAHGCPAMNISVSGVAQSYQYDCFTDTSLIPDCFTNCSGCSNHGECVNGACNCEANYTGNICEFPSCKSLGNCYGNGECVSPQKCVCIAGYRGDNCADANCDALNSCNGHGECMKPNNCTCKAGFTGAACDEKTCDPPCAHGGQCVKGSCECTKKWSGSSCESKVKDSSVTPSGVYVGVGVVVGLAVAGAGAAGAFVFWRRSRQQRAGRAFSSFDDGLIQVPESPEDDSS